MSTNSVSTNSIQELEAEQLYTHCDPEQFDFETTDDLEELHQIIGQERVVNSLEFGVHMKKDGFNIYALGPNETDKRHIVQKYLERIAADQESPCDYCYVYNFDDSSKPNMLTLPAGKATDLRESMEKLTEELDTTLTAAFESEEYQNRRQAIEDEVKQEQGQTFNDLQQKAQNKGLALVRTPAGFTFAPVKDGDIMNQQQLQELSDEEREKLEEKTEELQEELQKILRQMPARKRELRKRLRELDREIATYAIKDLMDAIREKFSEFDEVLEYLDAVQTDIVDNVNELTNQGQQQQQLAMLQGMQQDEMTQPSENPMLRRYKVNVLVDNSDTEGAPVIYEDNPNYKNLIGRVEYQAQMGGFSTDFNLIKPGALHRANGGYLVLDARRVLQEPYAWEGLKRALKSSKLKIESPGEAYGLISTVTLEPEPSDLNVKVVLLGERMLYYLLCEYDPEFQSLFKVEADFEDEMARNDDSHQQYARLLGNLVRERSLKALDKKAVARVIEHGARMVSDQEKLSTHTTEVVDLLMESDFWADKNGHDLITAEDVQKAIESQKYRSGRIRDKIQEAIERDSIYIDTKGEQIGQINGLSVLSIGNSMFGRPSRITAKVQLGKGDIINIDREVDMSGPIHSKGVLILKGFLGSRYGTDQPLSMSASLVFEQSYSGVDGDSASSTELYSLLSAIGQIPLRQDIAVTGSINQHGQIQPIGGVNDKIEGFFDICKQDGLTGDQGVLIPKTNVKNLMLRHDVVEAVQDGQFHIYPVETVEQGMELLTGLEMGERRDDGSYPDGSINQKVYDRLQQFVDKRKKLMKPQSTENNQ
jgi:lon-related putative ATP-dependent protease